MAGFAWFIPIYVVLVWRFYQHHTIEFGWLGIADTPQNAILATIVVFVLGLIEVSGVVLLLLMCAYIVFVGGQGV